MDWVMPCAGLRWGRCLTCHSKTDEWSATSSGWFLVSVLQWNGVRTSTVLNVRGWFLPPASGLAGSFMRQSIGGYPLRNGSVPSSVQWLLIMCGGVI